MKFSIKLTLYVGLLIIYFYLFGSKSLDKFKDGGVLINKKTLTQDSVKPKPGKKKKSLKNGISITQNFFFLLRNFYPSYRSNIWSWHEDSYPI